EAARPQAEHAQRLVAVPGHAHVRVQLGALDCPARHVKVVLIVVHQQHPRKQIHRPPSFGSVNQNLAPLTPSLSAPIRQPCRRTIFAAIGRPSPVPANARSFGRWNGWNTASPNAGSKPTPLSVTE